MPTAPPRHYFVRINAKVRGPFDVGRLVSMQGRGRLNPRDEVSLDRRQWVAAGTIPEVFPEGFAGTDRNPEALYWHYNCRGQQMGPVSLATLQTLAQGVQLASSDSVWKLGTPGWILSNQVPELTFAAAPASWWAKSGGSTKAGILIAASILVMAPIGLVLANYWHTIELTKQQIAQQLDEEKWQLQQQQIKEEQQLDLHKWQAEQDSKERMHQEALAASERARLAAERSEAKRDELLKVALDQPKQASSSGSASSGSAGGFSIGQIVRNKGYFQAWKGKVIGINGQTLEVRLTDHSSDSSEIGEMRKYVVSEVTAANELPNTLGGIGRFLKNPVGR